MVWPSIRLGASVLAAEEQGGLLSGKDPTSVNTADPIRLWIVQLGIIICTTQLLALALGKLRQPRVIAEVICGIVLGPTVMGRVPHFTEHIFPAESRSFLNLTSTIGLVLFLFLVGLEIDIRVIQRNAKNSAIIGVGAILLPLGIGFGMAVPIYHQFINTEAASLGHFSLFVAVAYSITAFPVLCRILSELKLLDTTIGIVVLSAGVANDIVGWTLLALTIALVNAGSGLTALYILLVAIGWTLVILFPVKMAMLWLARKTGSVENGPTPLFMTISIMMMFASAFFTDVIGVHAIFGAFLAGLAIPHEGGLAIALTEKLEDLTSIIFLPLYFTLSGLSTDLGLLNDGITWGYTILIIVTAYVGKAVGGTLGGRAAHFTWRESMTIGTLLSCKGLVELIVLNIGLNAGILDTRVFSMFVLEALVLTFMTTPATLALYPAEVRQRVTATGANFASVAPDEPKKTSAELRNDLSNGEGLRRRFTVVLDKMEHIPSLMRFTRLLQAPASPPFQEAAHADPNPRASHASSSSSSSVHPPSHHSSSSDYFNDHISVNALRLIELSERTSAMMKSAVADEMVHTDPLLSVYRTFGDLNDLSVSASLSIVTQEQFAHSVGEHAMQHSSDMIILPWLAPSPTPVPELPSRLNSQPQTPSVDAGGTAFNPFDALFRSGNPAPTNAGPTNIKSGGDSAIHSHFVRRVFAEAAKNVDVGLYVDQAGGSTGMGSVLGPAKGSTQHIVLPFFGGPDDRMALAFVVQLCGHPGVSATIVRMKKTEASEIEPPPSARFGTDAPHGDSLPSVVQQLQQHLTVPGLTQHSATGATFPDTVYANVETQTRLESDTADNIAWERYLAFEEGNPRISFLQQSTPLPIHNIISRVEQLAASGHNKRILVVVGRARRLAVESHHDELKEILGRSHLPSDVRKTVGDVCTGVLAGCQTSVALFVVQAATEREAGLVDILTP